MTAGVYEVESENAKFLSGDSSCGGSSEVINGEKGFTTGRSSLEVFEESGSSAQHCKSQDISNEDSGFNHDPVEDMDAEVTVVDDSESTRHLIKDVEDTKLVKLDVVVQDLNKEKVEIIYDNKESEVVAVSQLMDKTLTDTQQPATESVTSEENMEVDGFMEECNTNDESNCFALSSDEMTVEDLGFNDDHPVENKDIEVNEFVELDVKLQDPNKENVDIVHDDLESQIMVTHTIQDSVSTDYDAPEETVNETELEEKIINDPITEAVFEVKETSVIPLLILPETFVSPEVNIQFGSFGLYEKIPTDDSINVVLEVSNGESEPTSGANSSNLEVTSNNLQVNKSADKYMDDMEDSSDQAIEAEVPIVDDEKLMEQIEFYQLQFDYFDGYYYEQEIVKDHDEAFKTANMENPRHEIDSLEDNVSKEEVVAPSIRNTDEEESEKELQAQSLDEPSLVRDMGEKVEEESEKELPDQSLDEPSLVRDMGEKVEEESEKELQAQSLDEPSLVRDMGEKVEEESEKELPDQSLDEPSLVRDMGEKVATNLVPIQGELESISVISKVQREKKVLSRDNQATAKVARTTNGIVKTKEPSKFFVTHSKFACLREIMEDEEQDESEVESDANEKIACNVKEKVGEKKGKKKEKKRTSGNTRSPRRLNRQTQGDEYIVKPKETKKANQKAKTIRNRRQCDQWWKMVIVAVLTVIFFSFAIQYVQ